MNVVKLLGHFCTVSASTNGEVSVREDYKWREGDGFYYATFLACDGAWIEVRVADSYFEHFMSHFVEGHEVVQLEGHLRTDVSLGTGVVHNYIAIGY